MAYSENPNQGSANREIIFSSASNAMPYYLGVTTLCRLSRKMMRHFFNREKVALAFLCEEKKAFFSGYHTARVDGEFHVLFRFSKTLITLN